MKKFREILESDKYSDLRFECKELFVGIWSKKLKLGTSLISGTDENAYQLSCNCFANMNDKYYDDFRVLFDLLRKLNISFYLGTDCMLRINFENIKEFIDEMKIIKNSEKYNL